MKVKDGLKYMLECMTVFLLTSCLEIFIFRPLVDLIGEDFRTQLIVYSICILIINPVVTYFTVEKAIPLIKNREL